MLLIIMHHYAIHSGFQFSQNVTVNRIIVQFLTVSGKVGVDIFVIITGYFIIHNKFNVKKIVHIILQTFTYSIVFLILNLKNASIKEIIKSILPITYSQYWFITTYLFLYLLSPFINKMLEVLKKNEHRNLLIILIIVESIIPTFLHAKSQTADIVWFITLYILGAYINKYYNRKQITSKIYIIILSISYILLFASVLILDLLGVKISSAIISHALYFSGQSSVLILLISVTMFLIFKNMKIQSKFVNKVASTVFGIYIIQENTFMRDIIWKNIFQGWKYVDSPYLVINAIVAIITTFIVLAIIEYIRQKIMNPIEDKIFFKLQNKILIKIKAIKEKYLHSETQNNKLESN